MGFKTLSTIEVSEISAVTGIGNILEAKLTRQNDLIIVLRMDDEDMVSVLCLNRIADYFSVSQEDVILNSSKNGLEVNVMGQFVFTFEESSDVEIRKCPGFEDVEDVEDVLDDDEDPWPHEIPGPPVGCCGSGGCAGCPVRKD